MKRSRTAASTMAIALAVCLSACAAPTGQSDAQSRPSPTPTVTAAPARTPAVEVPVTSSAPREVEPRVAPTNLLISDISVDMPVVPVGVDGGSQMELPVDPAIAGWYRFGPDANADEGHMVLSAHVDAPNYPIGPLAGLRDLDPGASIVVEDESGAQREYRVASVTYYPKTDLPVDELFDREGEHALVVITCGGPFDSSTGRYRDNVVVVAVAA
ncbi:class F sortase [Microbacterium sp. C7(2022)]|uniref:class F sortase n=1 Tax=Microbacterium sp. C7(2022) TaxID=2992759 RepID=UPI00237AA1CE|nr:class F sortase [Microbacterium sp. C7(2022)]MDE0546647.1 sortase [Microbacterium sp. C7(2022)]